ncbi:MAG: hypothetical protein J6U96_00670 [Elusimicrobiaceae bacterium]|nr:hypothetical protein [Elusimicrobiaceae bacterium]
MTDKKIVHIFWTGGWDSTYRIVELSRVPVSIQPIYVADPSRRSQHLELRAMDLIMHLLEQKPETKAVFLPIKQINLSSLSKDPRVEEAWNFIFKTVSIGSQYKWLPVVAKQYPGIELCIEKPSGKRGGCTSTLHQFGKLIQNADGSQKLDTASSAPQCSALFENVSFPILSLTEQDMLERIKTWGYEDVMKLIWFCNNPLNNHCCGFCTPCQQKMSKHMEFLLDETARRRYKVFRFLSALTGKRIAMKLCMLYFRIFKSK